MYIYKCCPSCAPSCSCVLTQFDSIWGFTPYVGPAVAPSGAVDWNPLPNVALGVFGLLPACVVTEKLPTVYIVCCSLVLHTSTKDFQLLLVQETGLNRDTEFL